LHLVIQTTASSMHSLHHLASYLRDDRFLLCTVDSIVLPHEFAGLYGILSLIKRWNCFFLPPILWMTKSPSILELAKEIR